MGIIRLSYFPQSIFHLTLTQAFCLKKKTQKTMLYPSSCPDNSHYNINDGLTVRT